MNIYVERSTSLKLDSLNRKLYVNLKKCLNLENPITSKSVWPLYKIVQTEIILFISNYSLQFETSGAYKIVIFVSTSLKSGLFNRKLYVNFKNCLNLENLITNESETLIRPVFGDTQGRTRGGGIHGGGSFNITSACISLPQVN